MSRPFLCRACQCRGVVMLCVILFVLAGVCLTGCSLFITTSKPGIAAQALALSPNLQEDDAVESYIRRIDQMTEDIRAQTKPDATPAEKLQIISNYLYNEQGFSFDTIKGRWDRMTLDTVYLDRVLDNKKGSCVTLTILYLALTDRLGYPCQGVKLPNHVLVQWSDDEQRYYVETTKSGQLVALNPEHPSAKKLEVLEPERLLLCVRQNEGACLIQDIKRREEGIAILEQVVAQWPEFAEAQRNLADARKLTQVEALKEQAKQFSKQMNWAQVITSYEEVVKVNPKDVDAWIQLQFAYSHNGQDDKIPEVMRRMGQAGAMGRIGGITQPMEHE